MLDGYWRKTVKEVRLKLRIKVINPAFTADTSSRTMDVFKMWTCIAIVSLIVLMAFGLVPWGVGLRIVMTVTDAVIKLEGKHVCFF